LRARDAEIPDRDDEPHRPPAKMRPPEESPPACHKKLTRVKKESTAVDVT